MHAGQKLDQSVIMADVKAQLQRRFQHLLDKTAPHGLYRWIGFAALIGLYLLRVYFLGGFYIVTYGLGIYLLNLFIGFITPPVGRDMTGAVPCWQHLPHPAGSSPHQWSKASSQRPRFHW
jgi:hypothetical protein